MSLDAAVAVPHAEARITYDPIHVSESTFLAGLATHIHRWFRLTPSFGPDLVREMLNVLSVTKDDYVLDPFSGAGTTSIETSLYGIESAGFEINPFLHFVGNVSTNWSLDVHTGERALDETVRQYRTERPKVSFETLAEGGYTIPPIHNPTRWWRPDVLTDLLVLLRAIERGSSGAGIRDFLRLALAGVLVPELTNVTLGRLQLHFIDRSAADIDVLGVFSRHVEVMLSDLRATQKARLRSMTSVLLQDSTTLSDVKLPRKVTCVITSPPYPNRYSYVWNTRPHLYLFGFLGDARGASRIDQRTIGGTWGVATSELQKGVIEPLNTAVETAVGSVVNEIRRSDNLMANYAVHYFNRLTRHLLELEHVCAPKARVAYVVGNSWLKDVYIATDVLLAGIMERLGLGYRVTNIHRFRRRHSGKNLFESIVYAEKQLPWRRNLGPGARTGLVVDR